MRGGKLSCKRTKDVDSDCLTVSCVDYEKGIFNSFKQIDCNKEQSGWVRYFDVEAKAYYWYNHDTGEATWYNNLSTTKGGKKRRSKKSKKRVSKKNKTHRIKKNR